MPGRDVRVRLARLLPAAWLVLVWMLLWGTFSWANLLGGLAVGLVVMAFFPLPDVTGGRRLRPWGLLRVLGGILVDFVRSSAQVAWQSVRPGPPIRSSVVAVRLATRSELLIAVAIEALSLVPGSVVVDTDPEEGIIYAHVLGASDDAAVEAFRRQVARLEANLEAGGLGGVTVAVAS
jgi:multicomponent Na+:H+ antiporter subunit E